MTFYRTPFVTGANATQMGGVFLKGAASSS